MGKGMEIFPGLFGLYIVWLLLYSITNTVKTNQKVFQMQICTFACGFSTEYIGCGKFSQKSPKNGQGYGNISWFIWPLNCMVAPILHNKCSKNQPKGILNAFLHHCMWVFHCMYWVWEIQPKISKKWVRVWKYFLFYLAFTLYGCSYVP